MLKAKYKYAVTHEGRVHRDDLMTTAIVLASDAVTMVSRRPPTADELEDPEVLVFDTGHRHEPEKGNFDHHQLHDSHEATCALWMVMQHMGLHEAMMDLFSWYKITAVVDSKGPFRFAESVGARWDNICGLIGPLDDYLSDKLRKVTTVDKSTAPWLVEVGESVMATVNGYLPFVQKAEQGAVRSVEIRDVHGLVALDCDPADIEAYLAIWRRRLQAATGQTYAFSVTRDDRGPGLCLYRYADDKRVNFQQCTGDPATVFVHAGGFLVKTKEPDMDEAKRLILRSIKV
jgi:hypothetical protein